jgi:hypothetical protein
MDRTLTVLKNGQELAKLEYHYSTPLEGIVTIHINELKDMGNGLIAVYPLSLYTLPVQYDKAPATIAELKAGDKVLLASQEHFVQYAGDKGLAYVYPRMQYRYTLGADSHISGIANIAADFDENSKTIHFISAQSIRKDTTFNSDSVTTNEAALRLMYSERFNEHNIQIQIVDK